jgi:RNA polymerase sigma-70 factor (ECF subfamily)
VLDAIYAAYGRSWDLGVASDDAEVLRDEGVHLAQVLASLLPEEPEALALHALLESCEARSVAKRVGGFTPLDAQDQSLWDHARIERAEVLLRRASVHATPGRYQIEAAIQSCHVARRLRGLDTSEALLELYSLLLTIAPSLGAELGAVAALARLDTIDPLRVREHQPYWALRADLLGRAGLDPSDAFERAIALTVDPGVRRWLLAARRAATVAS